MKQRILKKYEELWDNIRNFIRSITNNSDDHDKKYMKIKYNWDDDLPLNKTLKLRNMVIIVRSVFLEGNRYYPQVFLNECLCKKFLKELMLMKQVHQKSVIFGTIGIFG